MIYLIKGDESGENPYASNKTDLKILKKFFKDIRKIVCLFNSLTILMQDLLEEQEAPKLVPIQDIIIRWNSVYTMVERFIVLFDNIKIVLNRTSSPRFQSHRTKINLINKRAMLIKSNS